MIDLETLSTNPNATILTVGGVKFDPYTMAEPSQGMYFRVDVDSQTEMGRDVMQETVNWWSKQPKEIIRDKIECETLIKENTNTIVRIVDGDILMRRCLTNRGHSILN